MIASREMRAAIRLTLVGAAPAMVLVALGVAVYKNYQQTNDQQTAFQHRAVEQQTRLARPIRVETATVHQHVTPARTNVYQQSVVRSHTLDSQPARSTPTHSVLPTINPSAEEIALAGPQLNQPLEEEPRKPNSTETIAVEPITEQTASSHSGEVNTEKATKTDSSPVIDDDEFSLFDPPVYVNEPANAADLSAAYDEDGLLITGVALTKLNEQLKKEVQLGFQLGKSGALFAARQQFILVLRKIALAKDAGTASGEYMRALAAGLRALDESESFQPQGDLLESDLDIATLARAHTTPVLHGRAARLASSQEAIALYAKYAAKQLGRAAEGMESGSMALYGLGKSYARLEAQEKTPGARLKSDVMYRAAVAAHSANYLAANELGVRLAAAGRYEQARRMLKLATQQPATATVYENLAAVERKLGNESAAQQVATTSIVLAESERERGEVSRRHGIEWVSPEAFQRSRPATPGMNAEVSTAAGEAAAPAFQPPLDQQQVSMPDDEKPSRWSRMLSSVRRATGWERREVQTEPPTPAAYPAEAYPANERAPWPQTARQPNPTYR